MARFDCVRQLLDDFVRKGQAVGVSTVIRHKGEEVFFGSAGSLHTDGQIPFDRSAIMMMFSMTKVVTAAAIMKLMDDGVLTPQTPVSDFIPEYADTRVMAEDGTLSPLARPLTIHDLLTMTSGIPYPDNGHPASALYGKVQMEHPAPETLTTLELVKRFASCPLCFQPGEKWLYGLSADVLGGVIVAATGMELGEYLKKTFFDPLGMTDTSFRVPEEKQRRVAGLYNVDGQGNFVLRQGAFRETPRVEMGGAGLYSTLDDFARFGEMLRQDGAGILSPEAVRLMSRDHLTPAQTSYYGDRQDGYGYGYLVRTMNDAALNRAYLEGPGAFGWNGMAGTSLRIDPARETTVVFGIQRVPADHDDFLPVLMQRIAQGLEG